MSPLHMLIANMVSLGVHAQSNWEDFPYLLCQESNRIEKIHLLPTRAPSVCQILLMFFLWTPMCIKTTKEPNSSLSILRLNTKVLLINILIHFIVDCLNLKNFVCKLTHSIIEMYSCQDNIHILRFCLQNMTQIFYCYNTIINQPKDFIQN